ncbi:MAG: selenide, water dikinase SelD [SAR324 cluster bacterium]|nr:selenide, water dikinase SelD [SAR324 cluster bacterium]
MSPVGLSEALAQLPPATDGNLLVGIETSDDAGVYRLSADSALVVTADFITPPVDDPYLFGQVAATNAINDIYAMGARPVTCYNLVGFPSGDLPLDMLSRIMAGALSKIQEAGAVLAGGHSTEDDEPKFGLAVNGLVHPDKIWRNSGAQAGDRLILTKPIGSGVLFNANLKRMVSPAAMEACLEQITTLNKAAAEVLDRHTVHACTDITGFGFAGHSFEMAHGAALTFAFDLEQIPVMDQALEMYRRKVTTGVNGENKSYVMGNIRFEVEVPAWHREIVYDPQTAGGLLAAVPAGEAQAALDDFKAHGVPHAAIVGEVLPMGDVHLIFR